MSYLLGQLKHLTFIKGTACKILNLLVLFVISNDFRRIPEVLKMEDSRSDFEKNRF